MILRSWSELTQTAFSFPVSLSPVEGRFPESSAGLIPVRACLQVAVSVSLARTLRATVPQPESAARGVRLWLLAALPGRALCLLQALTFLIN